MSDNHLLLLRINELMLQQEQYSLSVDMLFDDSLIGDFVKRIQIDSPYQQMLLEGVLTESVCDENLFVRFTVEGYFHYVLGEVLLEKYNAFGGEFILNKLKESEWIHLPLGLSQMLIHMVQNGEYQFLIRALKEQVNDEILVPSIIQTLIIGKKTDFINQITDSGFWSKVLNSLMGSTNYNLISEVLMLLPSSLSLTIMNDSITRQITADILTKLKQASSVSDHNYFLDFYLGNYEQVIKNYEESNNSDLTECEWVCIISALIDTGKFNEAVHVLKENNFSDKNSIEELRLLAISYHGANKTELANTTIDAAISQSLTQFGSYHFKSAELLNLRGLLSLSQEDFDSAEIALKKALSIFEKSKGKSNFEFISSTGNLALVAYHSSRLDKAIRIWMYVIDLLTGIGMKEHPETALVQKNLAFAYYDAKDLEQAKYFTEQALQIFITSGMQQTASYMDCQNLLKKLTTQ
jgi:tetratricopeptide (TPR) repeat protein